MANTHMANTQMSEHVRYRLAQSIPVIERHRAEILRVMQNRLVAFENKDEPFGQGDVVAMMLVGLLIDCASDIAAFGGTRDLRPTMTEHKRLEIGGRYYSRFGMALAAVFREVLGPRASPQIISAWCDTYWFVIGKLSPGDALPTWDGNLYVVR